MLDPVQPGGYQTNSEAEEKAIIQLHEMNPKEWVIMYLFQTLLLLVPSTCSYYCYKGILNRPPSPSLSLSLLGAGRRDAGKEFTCPGTCLTSTASLRWINRGKKINKQTIHTYLKKIQPSDVPHEVRCCRVSTAASSVRIRPCAWCFMLFIWSRESLNRKHTLLTTGKQQLEEIACKDRKSVV